MLLFEKFAEDYFALETRRSTLLRDVRGLLRIFRARGCARVMDLGCGTGEHAAILHRAGLDVIGLDRSPNMIRVARERFPGLPFVVADMRGAQSLSELIAPHARPHRNTQVAARSASETSAIDGAYSLFGTLNYLHSDDAVSNALTAVTNILRPGGLLVLEVWHPGAYAQLPAEIPSTERLIQSGNREIRRRRSVQLTPDRAGFVTIRHRYEIRSRADAHQSAGSRSHGPRVSEHDSGLQIFEEEHRLRLFEPDSLRGLAAGAGLRALESFADLAGGRPRPSSAGLLLVFEKQTPHVGR